MLKNSKDELQSIYMYGEKERKTYINLNSQAKVKEIDDPGIFVRLNPAIKHWDYASGLLPGTGCFDKFLTGIYLLIWMYKCTFLKSK